MLVGVLAIQGAVREHSAKIEELGADVRLVKKPQDFDGLDGLIIPGGESTTFMHFMENYSLNEAILKLANENIPIMGTCAGLIVMAKEILPRNNYNPLGILDVIVERNAYGRQKESFELPISVDFLKGGTFNAVFIRAPIIRHIGRGVKVVASIEDGVPVFVQEGNRFGLSFHPELTSDNRIHKVFLEVIADRLKR